MVGALDSRSLIGSGTGCAGMTVGPPHFVIPAKAGIQNLQPNFVFLYNQIINLFLSLDIYHRYAAICGRLMK